MTVASLITPQRNISAGLHETLLAHEDGTEMFLTAWPQGTEGLPQMLARVSRRVRQCGGQIVTMTVVEGAEQRLAALGVLRGIFGAVTWPITWVQGDDPSRTKVLGVEIYAVHGPKVQPLLLRGRVIGCAWETARARHCVLGDLRDETPGHPAAVQTGRVLQDMVDGLAQTGMSFQHVYRTWFRNRDILAWYREFNQIRNAYYRQLNVFSCLLPASTGISAANPFGAALVAGLAALEPKGPSVRAYAVDSPLQNAAANYGSSFSRAAEVDYGDHRLLTISGTASIDPAGNTVHVGDVAAQVDLTMRVVGAILQSRGKTWSDLTRGLAYFRHSADLPQLARWCRAHEIIALPVITSTQTVCRDDLLFEIEVDAV